MRREDQCINCGEPREIASRGLCFKCYRRGERARDRPVPNRHNLAIRKEHKKLFHGLTSVMTGMSELGVTKADVLEIRQIIEPYLAPIAEFLSLKLETTGSEPVNSVSNSCSPFTQTPDDSGSTQAKQKIHPMHSVVRQN